MWHWVQSALTVASVTGVRAVEGPPGPGSGVSWLGVRMPTTSVMPAIVATESPTSRVARERLGGRCVPPDESAASCMTGRFGLENESGGDRNEGERRRWIIKKDSAGTRERSERSL